MNAVQRLALMRGIWRYIKNNDIITFSKLNCIKLKVRAMPKRRSGRLDSALDKSVS